MEKRKIKEPNVNPSMALNFLEFQQIVVNDIQKLLKDNNMFRPKKYEREQIRQMLQTPENNERQLREVSQYLMLTSNHYRRLVGYFSGMLTLDFILMPLVKYDKLTGTAAEVFRRNYERSSRYMENFNVKHELSKVVKVLMMDGVFFGYERQEGDSISIQRLPANYCKITGTEDGVISFAFNFQFFKNEKILDYYPEEFRKLYAKAKATSTWWQELDTNRAVCFKYDEENLIYSIPPFTGVYEDILDLEDYKDLKKSKTKLDNYKLLVQKIPMKKDPKSEKDFVLTLDSVKMFHNNIKGAIPPQVGIISTPMELQDFNFEKQKNEEDVVGMAERSFFNTAGVSAALFNAENSGSIGLNRSIQFDEAEMFKILRQFERFFKKRLGQINNKTYPFKVWMPDITVYNRADMLDKALNAAQYGFPRLLVAACLGMSQTDLVSLVAFETQFLNLENDMIPLNSAHTTTTQIKHQEMHNSDQPLTPDSQLSDSGAATRDGEKNANRASSSGM